MELLRKMEKILQVLLEADYCGKCHTGYGAFCLNGQNVSDGVTNKINKIESSMLETMKSSDETLKSSQKLYSKVTNIIKDIESIGMESQNNIKLVDEVGNVSKELKEQVNRMSKELSIFKT